MVNIHADALTGSTTDFRHSGTNRSRSAGALVLARSTTSRMPPGFVGDPDYAWCGSSQRRALYQLGGIKILRAA